MITQNPVHAWLSEQSTATQRKLAKLQREHPRDFDDFLALLAEIAPLAKPSLLPSLHNFWSCVHSKLAFTLAVMHCTKPADVDAFLRTAEAALLEPEHVTEFESLLRADDPFPEILSWLRDQAYRLSL